MASPNINVLMTLQDRFSPALRNIAQQTNIATTQLRQADKAVSGLANGFKTVALGLSTAMAGAIAGVVGYSVSVGADFESGMSKVKAISGASTAELEKLTAKAQELGEKTSLSATEVSQAMQFMAMAGWDTTAINNGVEGLVRLAEASGEELGKVSDIVTDAMTAFHMSSEEVGRFGDVLSATATSSNTNIGMMGETFKEVSALAGSMGYSIEDMAIAIGTMANAGIKGGKAGTALKNAISNMASPTKAMQDVMSQLGLSLTDNEGKVKSFRTVMSELRTSFAGLTESEKASASATLFGKESMAGMLAIINASESDFQKLTGAIDNSTGSTEKMAITMNQNFSGAVKSFKSKVEAVGIAIYDKFKTPITEALLTVNDEFSNFIASIKNGELSATFDQLGEKIGKAITAIAKGIITILPVVMTLFDFIVTHGETIIAVLAGIGAGFAVFEVVTTITTLMGAFSVALEGVTTATALFNAILAMNPIGLVCIAIGILVGLLTLLYIKWDVVNNELQFVWNKLVEFATWVGSGFVALWNMALNAISEIFSAWVSGFTTYIEILITLLNGIIDFITNVFAGNWAGAWETVVNTFATIFSKISEIAGNVLNWITDKVASISSAISNISLPSFGGGERHNATGTGYFSGGSTFVNENNRGELINLPNGSQIIPHDLAEQTVNNSTKQNISINVNINGNLIGNEEFINECGSQITARLQMALANS